MDINQKAILWSNTDRILGLRASVIQLNHLILIQLRVFGLYSNRQYAGGKKTKKYLNN